MAAAPAASAATDDASSATGQSIASIALSQVGVSTTPAATSFRGVDCNPYSTLVGAQSPNADGCGRNAKLGIANENEAWCADFAKWVWQQAGVTKDMQYDAGLSLTSWASRIWHPGEQWLPTAVLWLGAGALAAGGLAVLGLAVLWRTRPRRERTGS